MNDYDSILKRLKENINGKLSTIEGSFCGDILCAVANELAKFYSLEIESIYEKAFVNTAVGDWLDKSCANWGIIRRENETDEELRNRTLRKLQNQSSSGNVSDYKEWAMTIKEVKSAQVVAREKGKVDVYIITGLTENEQILQRVSDYIETKRPIGAIVSVKMASIRIIPVTAKLKISPRSDFEIIKAEAQLSIEKYFEELTNSGEIIYIAPSRVANAIYNSPDIIDITGLQLESRTESIKFLPGQYPVLGKLTFTKVS